MLTDEWHRSSRCSSGGCIAARRVDTVEVADTKLENSPVLRFGPESWRQFVAAVRDGEFG